MASQMAAASNIFNALESKSSLGQGSFLEKRNKTRALKQLESLKKIIFSNRPLLEKIYYDKAHLSLFELTSSNHTNKQSKVNLKRQKEFISTFKKSIEAMLGKEVAESAASQLQEYYYLSTTEHHGPITHPGKLNSTLLTSLLYSKLNQKTLKNVIVLACANISFDNYSFPRGIQFNTMVKGEIKPQNLVFFPRAVRPCPVVYFKPYGKEAIDSAHAKLNELIASREISKELAEKIHGILDEVYSNPKALSSKSFSDQVTVTNFDLWAKMHNDPNSPNLIYFEQEKIINELILKHHIKQDTIVNKILFNPKYHKLILKHFDEIMGAFNSKTHSGTFLFWGLPKGEKYRVQLWKKGEKLVTKDGAYSYDLTPEAISKALKNKEIYPGTLLSFIVLSFYYGVKLLGSFNQSTYLSQMKDGFIKLLEEVKLNDEIEYIKAIPTDDLTYPRPILAFLDKIVGEPQRTPATALDLILYGNEQTLETLMNNSLVVRLKEALDRVMPDLYVSYIPEAMHEEKYLKLTPEMIDSITGIDKKIEPFVKL